MTISGIIYPKCLKNEKDIKVTKVGLEAEAADLKDSEAASDFALRKPQEDFEDAGLKDAEAASDVAADENQYIAIRR